MNGDHSRFMIGAEKQQAPKGSYDLMVESAAAIIKWCATELRGGVTTTRQAELTRMMLNVRNRRDAVEVGDDWSGAAVHRYLQGAE